MWDESVSSPEEAKSRARRDITGQGARAQAEAPGAPDAPGVVGAETASGAAPVLAAQLLLALIFVMLVAGAVYSYVLSLE